MVTKTKQDFISSLETHLPHYLDGEYDSEGTLYTEAYKWEIIEMTDRLFSIFQQNVHESIDEFASFIKLHFVETFHDTVPRETNVYLPLATELIA